jgi:hypothetical protein
MHLQPKLRAAATLGVLVILMLVGLAWGWTKLMAPLPGLSGDSDQTPTAVCSERTVAKGEKVNTGEVTVSVFNAGTTDGLATKTMEQLETRGFAPGETGNAPNGVEVGKVQIWADDPRNPAVQLVSGHLGRHVKVVNPTGEPLGLGVVVLVGDDFSKLTRGRSFVKALSDAEICSPN